MAKQIKTISDLSPDVKNANRGTQRGRGMVEASLREVGAGRSIVVDKEGRVIAGNKTLEGIVDIGLGIQVVQTDGRKLVVVQRTDLDLSDDTGAARKLAYLDNQSSSVGLAWDAEQMLADLNAGVDLAGIFDQDELDALLAELVDDEPVTDPGPQVDKADELRVKWGVELGQMWQLGDHRLVCGDCTDAATVARLMGGERAILMVTDPPYAVNYDPQWRVGLGGGGTQDFANGQTIKNDDSLNWMPGLVIPDVEVMYVWTADKTIKDLQIYLESKKYTLAYLVIWNKDLAVFGRGDYHWRYEPCLYMVKQGKNHNWQGDRKQETVWDIPTIHSFKNGSDSGEWGLVGHGNQKPIECMARPIRNNSAEDAIVYDPFLGSGTTLIACEQLGRQCRAVEISPSYVAVALERWATATGRLPELVRD